ncbi:hypothetical protein KO506_01400 [Polaribacter vadi]|uniref:HEAT repeat domain-containing protein n=1 Tax=Polaribacter TaxID=52959 RepID=UPI001C07F903|nr:MULTISPECIES: hypothetical protein [Polaribacter]MBU3010055.1 hypothetical protein [Polaribacter vadi]MDO6739862.1 hypothetical protein [Polaribacter sp. 1_MG-2023]
MVIPLIESVIWAIVVMLVVIIVILIVYLKIFRKNIRIIDKKEKNYRVTVEENLIQFLYSEQDSIFLSDTQKKIIKKFKKGANSRRKRKIIGDTFFILSQEISGNMILTMHKLYEEIGLLKYTIKKLRSEKWNIIAIGIRDSRRFKIEKFKDIIIDFINHPKEEVRREAHLYFLELFGYDGLTFLDDLKVPLSEWDQIQLLGEIQKIENHLIIDVSKWLISDNDFVIIFILNVVKMFNRLETKEILLSLLHHGNIEVRLKAIETLIHFEVAESKYILKSKFKELTLSEKKATFKLLNKVATTEDVPFILSNVKNENFEIKHAALLILKRIDVVAYNKLEKVSEEDEDYTKIVNFLDVSYGF